MPQHEKKLRKKTAFTLTTMDIYFANKKKKKLLNLINLFKFKIFGEMKSLTDHFKVFGILCSFFGWSVLYGITRLWS